MKLTSFPQQTNIVAENQKEYLPMPVYKFSGKDDGTLVCCWKLTLKERLQLLFTGKIWHYIMTFNHPVQPTLLSVETPFKP